jgi:hypothetical protein
LYTSVVTSPMTTAQESTNGHYHSPLPCSFQELQQQNQSKDSTNDNSNSVSATPHSALFAASAYHVPPKLYAPKADSFRDTIPDGLSTMKMPDRCQFMFSDGRQCQMARSDIHPSLCVYHSYREEQLFGDPSCRCEARTLDFPELYSASRDLSTAAGVNRALAQVFRMLAQRRISRQEAATFAKLAHLLLQSIRAASQEQPIAEIVGRQKDLAANVHHPPRKGYPQDALFAANKVELSPARKSAALMSSDHVFVARVARAVCGRPEAFHSELRWYTNSSSCLKYSTRK